VDRPVRCFAVMATDVQIDSDHATLVGALYGELPAARAALLCHGANWDASGWVDIAPRFAERGVAALALNFRGYDGSSGRTNRASALNDVRNAAAWLRTNGARELALVGASMGGSTVLLASASVAPECVVAISAPVRAMSQGDTKRILGRKLFVCAERDSLGAASAVQRAFADAEEPKALRFFPGREHSRALLRGAHGDDALQTILSFVTEGLGR
jgi:dienelactone hydrolase